MIYAIDFSKYSVLAYNEYWVYQKIINQTEQYPLLNWGGPSFSLYVNDQIYMTADNRINKFDKSLNLLRYDQSNVSTRFRGIYFNETSSLIYVGDVLNNLTRIYDQNLGFIANFTTPFSPYYITGYNGMLVITDDKSNNISFFKNEMLIQNITTQCTSRVSSALFDNYNHMIILCDSPSNIYIYHTNGTYIGLSMKACDSNAFFMNFDFKNRLVVTCENDISIFY